MVSLLLLAKAFCIRALGSVSRVFALCCLGLVLCCGLGLSSVALGNSGIGPSAYDSFLHAS